MGREQPNCTGGGFTSQSADIGQQEKLKCTECGRPFSRFSNSGLCGFCETHKWYALSEKLSEAEREANRLNYRLEHSTCSLCCQPLHVTADERLGYCDCGRNSRQSRIWYALEDETQTREEAERRNRKEQKKTGRAHGRRMLLRLALAVLVIAGAGTAAWRLLISPSLHDPEAELETEPKIESGTESGIESGIESGTEPGIKSAAEAGTESGTKSAAEAGTESATESAAESGTGKAAAAADNGVKGVLARYLEALAYGASKKEILTEDLLWNSGEDLAQKKEKDWPGFSGIETLESAALPLEMSYAVYDAEEDLELGELTYTAGETQVTCYTCCVKEEDGWKIAGIRSWFLEEEEEQDREALESLKGVLTYPLLALNVVQVDALDETKAARWYRLLVPYAAEVCLSWQAGSETSEESAFCVQLYSMSDTRKAWCTWTMPLSASWQSSHRIYLQPGLYFVSVAPEEDYRACDYTICFSSKQMACIESEENGSIAKADPLALNQTVAASLQKEGDVDLYSFTVTEAGTAAVSFSLERAAENEKKSAFVLTLAAKTGENTYETLQQQEVTGRVEGVQMANAYLAPGEYLLQVQQGKQWTSLGYELTVSFTGSQNTERELNQSADTASPLLINETMQASLGTASDVDYYTFTLSEDALADVELTGDGQENAQEEETAAYTLSLMSGENVWYSCTGAWIQTLQFALPAGTYLVKVESSVGMTGEYQLRVNTETAAVEAEPDDTAAQAAELPVNTRICGSLLDFSGQKQQGDTDCYQVTLEEAGRLQLRFSFEAQEGSGSVYLLTIKDENGESLYTASLSGSENDRKTPSLYLGAGVYTIQVEEGRRPFAGAYALWAYFKETANGEQECNDTLETASSLAVNASVSGSFAGADETDFYQFVLETDAVVQPRLTFAALEREETAYVLSLQEKETVLLQAEIGGQESDLAIAPLVLPAGTYFLRLDRKAQTQQDYSLCVITETVDGAEQEPNGRQEQADCLTLGQTRTGVLSSASDQDLYQLQITEGAVVTLRFAFDAIDSEKDCYKITLEQNGEALQTYQVSGESGGCVKRWQITEGVYYIRIKKARQWTGSIYTLSVQQGF